VVTVVVVVDSLDSITTRFIFVVAVVLVIVVVVEDFIFLIISVADFLIDFLRLLNFVFLAKLTADCLLLFGAPTLLTQETKVNGVEDRSCSIVCYSWRKAVS
jgi:hypothetical protein